MLKLTQLGSKETRVRIHGPPKLLFLSVVTLPLEGVKVGKYIRIAFYLAPFMAFGAAQCSGWAVGAPLPIKRLVFLLKGEI